MAKSFAIGGGNAAMTFRKNAYKGTTELYTVDLSGWAEDNGDIDSVTWENVDGGGPAYADEALTSNVATARLTFGTEGYYLVKITASAGDNVIVAYIDLQVEAPDYARSGCWDYGWRHGCC